ncbi:MAG: hypothetical protein WAL67_09130 [Candidatus Cybelea sp.]
MRGAGVTVDASGPFIVQEVAYPNGTTLTSKLTTGDGELPIAVSADAVL